jgi:ribosomal protein L36
MVDSQQVDRMDYMQSEMVRRNDWIFEQVGEPAWLMFRKTRGESCGCLHPETVGKGRSGCPICFEVGIVGGYYGPYDFLYIDPDAQVLRKLEEGGITVERPSTSYLGPTPIVGSGDLIIRRNGERLVINNPRYKSPRGVILMQDFGTELLNKGDTRYLIPVIYPSERIFNPLVTEPIEPNAGAEPVTEMVNDADNGKLWENPDKQKGRTITFNRIRGGGGAPKEPIS